MWYWKKLYWKIKKNISLFLHLQKSQSTSFDFKMLLTKHGVLFLYQQFDCHMTNFKLLTAESITRPIFIHHCTFLNFTWRMMWGEGLITRFKAQVSASVEFKSRMLWFWVNALFYCTTLQLAMNQRFIIQ